MSINATDSSRYVNVYTRWGQYLVQAKYPWEVTAHDALVYPGSRIVLHTLDQPDYYVRLGPVVEFGQQYVVFQVYERPQGCPRYIKFPRSPPSSLYFPPIDPGRV